MLRYLLVPLICSAAAFADATADTRPAEVAPQTAVKVRPSVRIEQPAIEDMECDQLHTVSVASEAQGVLLSRRKRQCLGRYDAFIPGTGLR